ncbi:hypothetical protein AURDEDRAFT_183655 [Auricularia subglabra TFB-10046 SS5]|nr:hypothetical protein AURDEDRAFT_183655 [Auricularia subglabra TFB-10046 SS5]
MNAARKQDQAAARRAQRSHMASPYARPSQKPKTAEPGASLPSSSSLSNLFSFLTAPFRKKEPETRPALHDRDSETEVSRAMIVDDDDDDDDDDDGDDTEPESIPVQANDFATGSSYTPAAALSLRGQQMQQTLAVPVAPRPFVPVPQDDPRRTGKYIPKPSPRPPVYMDPAAPFNPPIPFPNSAPTPEPTPPPEEQVEQALDHMQVSPEKLDMVTSFLNEKRAAGSSLTEIEAAGIVKLIQDSVSEGVRPLAATPSKSFALTFGLSAPTTPIRPSKSEGSVNGTGPRITPSYTLPAFPPPDAPPSSIPVMKREAKNPNPPLQYRGAGRSGRARTPAKSASVTRASPAPVMSSSYTPTRYRSSAYGSSLKETTQQLALPSTESDVKRRKTNDGSSQPVASSSAPSSSTKPTASSNPFVSTFTPAESSGLIKTEVKPISNGFLSTPSTPIAGSSLANRPTFGVGTVNKSIPSKPSPLRQSMRPESPTSSPPQAVNGSTQASPATPSRVSRSFEVMQEVIEKNTPKKHDPLPEVANPYQTGSPFRAARKQPARKPAPSPVKAPEPKPTPAPEPPAKKELTALDLIEMSAPKNLKRAPAPAPAPAPEPKAARPKSPSPPRIPGSGAPFVRSSFAPSPSLSLAANARKAATSYVVEDDDDEIEEVIEAPKPKRRKPSPPATSSSMAVDEVIDLDEEPAPAPTPAAKKPAPVIKTKSVQGVVRDAYKTKEPSPLRQSFQPDSPPEKMDAAGSPQERAKQLPESELPTFLFPSSISASSSLGADPFSAAPLDAAKQKALRAPVGDLPTFSFTTTPSTLPPFSFATTPTASTSMPPPPAPTPSFNWAAAGFKPAPPKEEGAWNCGECTLSNKASATAKCAFCDAPKPGAASTPAPPPPTFNWGAAGFSMPAPKNDGSWTCGVCMLSNGVAAVKCTVCDAPKP